MHSGIALPEPVLAVGVVQVLVILGIAWYVIASIKKEIRQRQINKAYDRLPRVSVQRGRDGNQHVEPKPHLDQAFKELKRQLKSLSKQRSAFATDTDIKRAESLTLLYRSLAALRTCVRAYIGKMDAPAAIDTLDQRRQVEKAFKSFQKQFSSHMAHLPVHMVDDIDRSVQAAKEQVFGFQKETKEDSDDLRIQKLFKLELDIDHLFTKSLATIDSEFQKIRREVDAMEPVKD